MTGNDSGQSLAEFLGRYEPPPEDYVQHQQDLADTAAAGARFARESEAILTDLRAHGYAIAQLEDLDEAVGADAGAVGVLVHWLSQSSSTSIIDVWRNCCPRDGRVPQRCRR